jgi:hypothetical protein
MKERESDRLTKKLGKVAHAYPNYVESRKRKTDIGS